MLSRTIVLSLLASAAGLRVQQRALELLNSTESTKKDTDAYPVSTLCYAWSQGRASIRNCFPTKDVAGPRDWVYVLAFLVLHPYRCINGLPSTGAGALVTWGGIEVPYTRTPLLTGDIQAECLLTSNVNPIKAKALIDPFNLINFTPLRSLPFHSGTTAYFDPFGWFLDQPARLEMYAGTACGGEPYKVQVFAGTAHDGTGIRKRSAMKVDICYNVDETNGEGASEFEAPEANNVPYTFGGCGIPPADPAANQWSLTDFKYCIQRKYKCSCSASDVFVCNAHDYTTSGCNSANQIGGLASTEGLNIAGWGPTFSSGESDIDNCATSTTFSTSSAKRNFRTGYCAEDD